MGREKRRRKVGGREGKGIVERRGEDMGMGMVWVVGKSMMWLMGRGLVEDNDRAWGHGK